MRDNKVDITIEQLTSFSNKEAETIRTLSKTLGKNYKSLTDDDITEMITSPATTLFVARENGEIVGMITLVLYRIPYVRKAYLDDLVVNEAHRGQGIGSQLIHEAIIQAKRKGAAYVDFTSRPRRYKSNKLYEKLGFTKRETNVYRLALDYAEV